MKSYDFSGFSGPSDWLRTSGLVAPNRNRKLFWTFLTAFYRFRSFFVTLVTSLKPPFPPVPRASVVIHVVKKRFPPKKTGSVFTFIIWLIQRNTVSYLRCCHPYRRTTRNQRGSSGSVQLHQIHRVSASCRQCS